MQAPARLWQQAEGALVFIATAALLAAFGLPFQWWMVILIFFAPDLSFAGYLAGPRVGAAFYNTVHLYGFGAVVLLAGILTETEWMTSAGALWVAHAGFDRMLGYGLKLPTGFDETHLGRIGKRRTRD
jgi:Domain of unknown function (DUF4260)